MDYNLPFSFQNCNIVNCFTREGEHLMNKETDDENRSVLKLHANHHHGGADTRFTMKVTEVHNDSPPCNIVINGGDHPQCNILINCEDSPSLQVLRNIWKALYTFSKRRFLHVKNIFPKNTTTSTV